MLPLLLTSFSRIVQSNWLAQEPAQCAMGVRDIAQWTFGTSSYSELFVPQGSWGRIWTTEHRRRALYRKTCCLSNPGEEGRTLNVFKGSLSSFLTWGDTKRFNLCHVDHYSSRSRHNPHHERASSFGSSYIGKMGIKSNSALNVTNLNRFTSVNIWSLPKCRQRWRNQELLRQKSGYCTFSFYSNLTSGRVNEHLSIHDCRSTTRWPATHDWNWRNNEVSPVSVALWLIRLVI